MVRGGYLQIEKHSLCHYCGVKKECLLFLASAIDESARIYSPQHSGFSFCRTCLKDMAEARDPNETPRFHTFEGKTNP